MKLLSNVVCDYNEENNSPDKLLLTNTQVLRLGKVFSNGLSANIKLSKTHLYKIEESGGSSSKFL